MTDKLTVADIQEAIVEFDDYHKFHEHLCHKLGITTKTDIAIHKRNLARVQMIKDPKKNYTFNPMVHKASYIEDEYAEFRESKESV
jgi:TFIIF-interacting CTD phosphatase-like protein